LDLSTVTGAVRHNSNIPTPHIPAALVALHAPAPTPLAILRLLLLPRDATLCITTEVGGMTIGFVFNT
jgi:hypothetical protein